jgi:hypothetical protein
MNSRPMTSADAQREAQAERHQQQPRNFGVDRRGGQRRAVDHPEVLAPLLPLEILGDDRRFVLAAEILEACAFEGDIAHERAEILLDARGGGDGALELGDAGPGAALGRLERTDPRAQLIALAATRCR